MAPPKRPIPDDFDQVAARLKTVAKIMAHYTAGEVTVINWMRERGLPRITRAKHTLPADFTKWAKVEYPKQLQERYGCGHMAIQRFAREAGVTLLNGHKIVQPKFRPCPPDFAQVAPTMLRLQLRRHYNCGDPAIDRWCAETGVTLKTRARNEYQPQAGKLSRGLYHAIGISANIAASKPYTIYDRAADTLRRYGPVYRCNERGKQDNNGQFWRIGLTIATPEQLLARAARYEKVAA